MHVTRLSIGLALLLCAFAGRPLFAADEEALTRMEWDVEGVQRQAIVVAPPGAKEKESPLIFAFHGHGGTARQAALGYNYQKQWPEAICVYMQGLPTVGKTDPEGKKPGWQRVAGELSDRDLKFFDAVLATMKKDYKVDPKRVYCTGHSNGGAFTYLLWAARGDVFAAVAPAAAGPVGGFKDQKPLPAMHIAGEKDTLVPFALQSKVMEEARKLNGCEPTGKPWAESGDLVGTLYASDKQAPFVSLIYPGPHNFPKEAPALIVKFFKEHAKT